MMLKPFVILFIITTNLCTILDSYKIINDQQDSSNPHEEYIAENYSNEDSYKKEFNGRVVIGKWRNNGEALEPKWRDGDSVPLAPFSTISFKNGWMRERDSREDEEDDHRISELSQNSNDNDNKNVKLSPKDENRDSAKQKEEENRTGNKNASLERTENHRQNESKPKIGYRNSHRSERQFNRSRAPSFDQDNANSSPKIRIVYPVFRVSSILREPMRKDDTNGDNQGSGKYRETLESYPNEYELFENENDDPRPRKRRPPEHYEFPGSLYADNKQGGITQSHESNVGNDVRRYSMTNQDRTSMKVINGTAKSQENVELKTFLKMQGDNLSLSEILQQKNLTLADILRGKPNAINILKSNDKKFDSTNSDEETSTKKSTLTETSADKILPNFNSGNSRWSNNPRRIMIRKLNKNSTLDDDRNDSIINLNLNQTNFVYETTTSRIIDSTTTEIKETDNIISSSSNKTTTFMMTDEKTSSEMVKHINESSRVNEEKKNKSVISHEFLKRLENRESLITESTTALPRQDATTEYASDDHPVSASNDQFLPANNNNNNNNDDDDEIMEFSDYPASKMPKFIAPMMIYESKIVNNRRKNIPFSAIRMNNNPVEDPELKLNIENILPSSSSSASEKKLTKNINETNNNDVMEESNKRREDEREEKMERNLKPMKNGEEENDEKVFSKDSVESKEEESVKSIDLVNEKGSSNGYEESFVQKEKDSTHYNHKLHEVVFPKIDPQSRAEILELFSSGSSAERLERLLASRNMTIEELIALRQRGSSQVHFAEVFKAKEQTSSSTSSRQNHKLTNDSKISEKYQEDNEKEAKEKMEKIDEKIRENDDSKNIEETKNLGINKNDIENKKKQDTFATEAEYLATDLFKLFSENKNSRKNFSNFDKTSRDLDTRITKSRNDKIDLRKTIENSDLAMTLRDLPAGNNIQRDSEGSSYYTSIESVKLPVGEEEEEEDEKKIADIFEKGRKLDGAIKSVTSEEIGRVEEILNNDLKSLKTSYGINDYEFSEKKALSKVKPSIIASGGILGVTVVVFLSIFIACRIQQKKKFAYKNSFAKAVFHNPVMNARKLSNTSSINTIMVDVVATSTTKRPKKHENAYESDDFQSKSEIDNDSLDANDSWDTIPDFMK